MMSSSPEPGPSRRLWSRRGRYRSPSSDSSLSSHYSRRYRFYSRSRSSDRSRSPFSPQYQPTSPSSPDRSPESAGRRSRSPGSDSTRSFMIRPSVSLSPDRRSGSSSRAGSRSLPGSLGSPTRSRSNSPARSRTGSPSIRSGTNSREGSPSSARSRSGSPARSERSGSEARCARSDRSGSVSSVSVRRGPSLSPTRSARSGSAGHRAARSHSCSSLAQKKDSSSPSKKVMKWCKENLGEGYRPSKEGMSQRFQFSLMRESETLTDMTLICDGKKFPCHKLILASSSQYFERMFQSDMQETQKNEVNLTMLSADILSIILDYMYSANINFTWQKTADVLRAADYLQMDTLKEMGSRYLMDKLKPSSALQIHQMAKLCNLARAQKKAWSTITNYFREVSCSRHFLRLPSEDLVEILSTNELYVANEDPVVHATLRWTHYKLTSRRKEFHSTLLPLLRLGYCTKYMLSHLISNEPLLSSEKCRAQLGAALAQSVAPQCHQPRLDKPGPRDSYLQHRHCLVLYGSVVKEDPNNRDYEEYSDMYFLDQNPYWDQPQDKELEWKLIDDLDLRQGTDKPYHRDNHFERQVDYHVCAMPRGFFVSGGREAYDIYTLDSYVSARAAMFNFETMAWQDIDDMQEGRYRHASVYLNDEVFILGGGNTSKLLSSVSVFDLVCGQWQTTSKRILRRVAYPAVATLGLNIYVFGGHDSSERFTDHAQVFNTCLNKWESVARMPACPSFAKAVSLADDLYVVGGLQPPVCLRYTPKSDSWVELRAPMFHHAHAALTTWQGKLVLGGGLYQAENTTTAHSQIELYDPESDSWEKAPSPPLTSQLPSNMSHICFAYAVYNDVKSAEDGYENTHMDERNEISDDDDSDY